MNELTLGLLIASLIFIVGIVWATYYARKQKGEKDENTSATRAKHPVLANPVLWTYGLFITVMFVIIYLLALYFNNY